MCEFQEIHIRLGDGYPAYARYWPVPNAASAALHIHGIQSHCGWYAHTARALRDAGIAVLQPDRRGSGRNRADRGHAESADQLIADAIRYTDQLRELTGLARVHLIGVSWGGKLVAAAHANNPSLTASLVLVAPGIFPIVNVSPTEKLKIGLSMVSAPKRQFDIPLNDPRLFTADPKWIEFLEQDPLQLHQATAGFYLASRRMDRIVARLGESAPVPIHVLLAADEQIIDNQRTRTFIRDLPWPHRHVTCYRRSRHTFEFGPDRDLFVRDLIRWVNGPTQFDPPPIAAQSSA